MMSAIYFRSIVRTKCTRRYILKAKAKKNQIISIFNEIIPVDLIKKNLVNIFFFDFNISL